MTMAQRAQVISPHVQAERPIKVALFSGNYNCVADGANQALNRLVGHLVQSGFDVRVFSPTIAKPAFAPQGTLISVPSIPIPTRSEYRVALGIPHAIRRELDAFAPDIIHVSAPDLLGRSAQNYAEKHHIPLVASLHTRFETYFQFYGLGFIRNAIEGYLRRFYQRCNLVLAPNPPMEDLLRADGVDADKIAIWSRGVDHHLFDPERRSEDWRLAHGYNATDPVILFFGRLVREKGILEFITTIKRLREKYPNIRPLIVGDGPARNELVEGLSNIVMTGHLRGPALARVITSADILLNPSTTEAFGNVNLEAMSAGLAVVSANAPSSRLLIEDGLTGILCQPDQPEHYVAAVADLIQHPEKRIALGRNARKASEAYQWNRALQSVADNYKKLIG